ncbi:hypothetical protein [Teredinibacter turnerae]|uniref:hypothetical protein n=1 Tax=Teredinibacter turnerae TaxID=2426 RepID=UPI000362E5EB|nr:hypothetical protein [Teredinibacter turnerae]
MIILNKARIKKSREIAEKLSGERLSYLSFVEELAKSGNQDELFYAISKTFNRFHDVPQLLSAMQESGYLETRGELKDFYEYSELHRKKYKKILLENISRTSPEDLFAYLEWQLNRLAYRNIGYDNRVVPENVSSSMHGSLVSTIPWICLALCNAEISQGKKKNLAKRNSVCKRIISSAGYYKTISNQLSGMFRGDYNVLNSEDFFRNFSITENMKLNGFNKLKYFLELTNKCWRKIEVYRDLNYKHYINREENIDALLDIGKKTGFISDPNNNGDVLRFDFANGNEFQNEINLKKSRALISIVYGGFDTTFVFKENPYRTQDLVDIHDTICSFCRIMQKENKKYISRGDVNIFSGNKEKLLSVLKISKSKSDLIDLFSLKINNNTSLPSERLPIIKTGGTYHVIPTYASDHQIENLTDRILSREDISIENSKEAGKGLLLENYLRERLSESGYHVHGINRNQKKNIPEIDGIFPLEGKYLILFEAKASIPPEEREDAYKFADNHISKAIEQLDERICFIKNQPKEFEERARYSAKELKIIPLIISNAHYFSGMRFVSPKGNDVWFLDATTFLKILCDGEINAWEPMGSHSEYTYRHSVVSLSSPESKVSALKKPYQFLKSTHRGTVQVLDHGVGFEIAYETHVF